MRSTKKRASAAKGSASATNDGRIAKKTKTTIPEKYVSELRDIVAHNPDIMPKAAVDELRTTFCAEGQEPADWPTEKTLRNKVSGLKKKVKEANAEANSE